MEPPAKPEPETPTDVPAGPKVTLSIAVGRGATVKLVSAKIEDGVGGEASVTLIVNGERNGFAAAFTAKAALTVPDVEMVHVVAGVEANRSAVGDDKVHVVAELLVANPPPVTVTLADPSVGSVPNPGGTAPGETTIVGDDTTLKSAVAAVPRLGVTVTV